MALIGTPMKTLAVQHLFKIATWTAPTNIYVALSTDDPGSTGAGTAEPVGNGYARVLVSDWTMSAANAENDNAINFGPATGSWGTIAYFALYTASSGGTYIARGQLAVSRTPTAGDYITLDATELSVGF